MSEIQNNNELFDNNIESNKELDDLLKMLDTKDWNDEFMKNLFALKEHFTETFWKPLFEKQFENNWATLIDSLYDFCKNIDINEFSTKNVDDQYQQILVFLEWQLWDLDLYREINLINAYINYDLKVEDTIRVDEILASASEKQMTNIEALENARLTRFAYADIEVDNKTWELSFIDTYEQKRWELLSLLDLSDLLNWNINIKDIPDTELTFNQKIFKEYLEKEIDNGFNVDLKVENWMIIITDNRISDDIKEIFSWKLKYDKNTYTNWDKYAHLEKIQINNDQLDFLEFTEEVNLLSRVLSIFWSYDRKKSIANYEKDYNEVIKGKYVPLEQHKDDGNWFSATILEDIQTKDILISVRWTNDLADILLSDLQIFLNSIWLLNSIPSQVKSLKNLLKEKEKDYNWKDITIVWHSLWWYLSELSEWLNVNLNIVDTINVNWPGWWDTEVDSPNMVWNNCVKFRTNELISNTWTQSNKFLVALPWDKHSIDSVIDNMVKNNEENENYLPIIDTSKLKDIF